MIIVSTTESSISDGTNVFKIMPGVNRINIDHKDPLIAMQLRVMHDSVKTITFQEILEGDHESYRAPSEETPKVVKKKSKSDSKRKVPKY